MDSLKAMMEPIKRRIMMAVARAVVRGVTDSGGRQQLQIELMKGELRADVERMQDYGITSVPLPGADAGVVFVAGNREQGIILAVDDRRYRPTGLQPGEVCIYTNQANHRVLMKAGQEIHLTAGASSIVMKPTGITITAPVINFVQG